MLLTEIKESHGIFCRLAATIELPKDKSSKGLANIQIWRKNTESDHQHFNEISIWDILKGKRFYMERNFKGRMDYAQSNYFSSPPATNAFIIIPFP